MSLEIALDQWWMMPQLGLHRANWFTWKLQGVWALSTRGWNGECKWENQQDYEKIWWRASQARLSTLWIPAFGRMYRFNFIPKIIGIFLNPIATLYFYNYINSGFRQDFIFMTLRRRKMGFLFCLSPPSRLFDRNYAFHTINWGYIILFFYGS